MGIKNFFVILVCSSVFLGCLKTPRKIKLRTETTKTEVYEIEPDGETQDPVKGPVFQSEKPVDFRPKIGLVLSPGLARTFSHVGVLKKIEEARIPLTAIVGIGWSALPAYEYSTEGALHGLEWKISRSEKLKSLLDSGFWKKEITLKKTTALKELMSSLVTDKGKFDKHSKFYCPVLKNKSVVFFKREAFEYCASTPPLFDSGRSQTAYIYGLKEIVEKLKKLGVQKAIYVDVLAQDLNWGVKENLLSSESHWGWSVSQKLLKDDQELFDHVIRVPNGKSLLDFESSLEMVKTGESSGLELVELLQKQYQF